MLNLTEKRYQMVRNCSSQFMLFTNYLGNQITEEEIGGTCRIHGTDEKSIQKFHQETSREETTCKA